MRSRYSAFVVRAADYLLATWHPTTRPSRVRFDDKQHWLGLRIKSTSSGTTGDTEGTVEFIARYKIDGKAHRLHELSNFRCESGCWYYVDGEHH
jgi:SEC-C motif-containing protein